MTRPPSISLPALRPAAGRTSRVNCHRCTFSCQLEMESALVMTYRFGIYNNRLPMSLGCAVIIQFGQVHISKGLNVQGPALLRNSMRRGLMPPLYLKANLVGLAVVR